MERGARDETRRPRRRSDAQEPLQQRHCRRRMMMLLPVAPEGRRCSSAAPAHSGGWEVVRVERGGGRAAPGLRLQDGGPTRTKRRRAPVREMHSASCDRCQSQNCCCCNGSVRLSTARRRRRRKGAGGLGALQCGVNTSTHTARESWVGRTGSGL